MKIVHAFKFKQKMSFKCELPSMRRAIASKCRVNKMFRTKWYGGHGHTNRHTHSNNKTYTHMHTVAYKYIYLASRKQTLKALWMEVGTKRRQIESGTENFFLYCKLPGDNSKFVGVPEIRRCSRNFARFFFAERRRIAEKAHGADAVLVMCAWLSNVCRSNLSVSAFRLSTMPVRKPVDFAVRPIMSCLWDMLTGVQLQLKSFLWPSFLWYHVLKEQGRY